MAAVTIRNVDKVFGSLRVVDGINVDIADGEFVVLVGPSGCGKSTLLRMIAGLEHISGGTISIGGRPVNTLPPKDRDVAMVFQNYALYPHMPVHANMGFSMKLRNAEPRLIEERVQRAAGVLSLADYLDRYPRQLSGGQRQRVAMGRAIVRDPKVFLFDEPLSNLDAKLRVQMRTEIKALHQRLKTTTVYVTHDQIEAMTMADRIVVMHAGNVEQVGTPLELYDRPANTFVAGFIGSPAMNLLPGTIYNGTVQTADGQCIAPSTQRGQNGQRVIVGIRPQHLAITNDNGSVGVSGTVAVLEPTGAETQIFVEYQAGTLTAVVRERCSFAPGTPVTLLPQPGSVHLFDAESGRRL
jgi:multiple sugar transport system ATP-binding protein